MTIPTELCWGTVEHASLEDMIDVGEQAGYSTLSIRPTQALAEGVDLPTIRQRLDDSSVSVNIVDAIIQGLPGAPRLEDVDARYRDAVRHGPDDCFATALALGAPTVNIAFFTCAPVAQEIVVDALGDLAEQARQRGLALTVEFIPNTSVPDLASAVAVVNGVGAGNLSVLVDTWHLARSGGTLTDLRALPTGIIGGVQLSDRVNPPPGTAYRPMQDRLLPAEGTLPLADTIRAIWENSPGVPLGVEVFSEALRSMTSLTAGERARDALATVIDAAGL